jgi:tetratricopeptide (TPR) repeat protein
VWESRTPPDIFLDEGHYVALVVFVAPYHGEDRVMPDEPGRPRPRRAPKPAASGGTGRPGRSDGGRGAPARSERERGAGAARPERERGAGAARPERDSRTEQVRQQERRGRDERRQARPPEPALPEGADPALLDRDVARELATLSRPNAERVAAHVVAAGLLLEADPAAAYEHAKFAKSLAGRVGMVREAVGLTAYRAGDYATALAELRAARRISGDARHLPVLADCERALGRPERALEVAKDRAAATLDSAAQVELAIVCSGARRDMGQADAAVVSLQGRALDASDVEEWTPRLWYAYADALLAAGRRDEAVEWFEATVSVDEDEQTDAAERIAALLRG